jgi:hypothetical protein
MAGVSRFSEGEIVTFTQDGKKLVGKIVTVYEDSTYLVEFVGSGQKRLDEFYLAATENNNLG